MTADDTPAVPDTEAEREEPDNIYDELEDMSWMDLAAEVGRLRAALARDVPAPTDEPVAITASAEWVRELYRSAQYTLEVPPMPRHVEWLVRDLHGRVTKLAQERSELEKRLAERDAKLRAVSDRAGTAPTDEPPYSRGWRVGDRVRVKATGERGEVEAALGDGVNVRIPQENAPSHVVHFTATDLVPDRAGDDEPRTEWRVTGWTSRGSRLTADRPSRSAADAEAEAMRDEGLRDVRVAPRVAAAPAADTAAAVDTAAADPLRRVESRQVTTTTTRTAWTEE